MPGLAKLEVLFDAATGGPELPPALAAAYGGGLALPPECLVTNLVESVDGVVALPGVGGESGAVVSGGSEADHLVMGLLRACADAVLVGAGTLRAAPHDLWLPEAVYPAAAAAFAALRAALGLAPQPTLYVVSSSGQVDPNHPALRAGAVVLTGRRTAPELVAVLRRDGRKRILCEGGPGLFAELLAARQVDEAFVTLSPRLFGRFGGDGRKALAEGLDLGGAPLELRSLRRSGSHLFLRYRCR